LYINVTMYRIFSYNIVQTKNTMFTMKDLTQYKFACLEAMYQYMQGIKSENELISKLREAEEYHQNKVGVLNSDKGFWFRFYKGDNLATTINDIATTIKLPKSHPNYVNMVDAMEIAIMDGSLEVYFS